MRTGRARVAALGFCALIALTGCSATSKADTTTTSDGTGFVAGDGSIVLLEPDRRMVAPDLVGTTIDGERFDLADQRGDIVVMNVWASWCAPCRAEAPILQQAYEDFTDEGVQFVGLDTRDSDASARAFIDRFGITYPNVLDPDGRLQLLFADTLPPQAIPSTIVIDRQGRVAARMLGSVSISELRGVIEPLLAEST